MPVPDDVSRAINSGEVRRALEQHLEPAIVEWLMEAIFIREHRNLQRGRRL